MDQQKSELTKLIDALTDPLAALKHMRFANAVNSKSFDEVIHAMSTDAPKTTFCNKLGQSSFRPVTRFKLPFGK